MSSEFIIFYCLWTLFMNIGKRLSNALQIKDIKTKDLVDVFGITQQYVSNIRKAEKLNDTIASIANHYQININWLISGNGEMFIQKDTFTQHGSGNQVFTSGAATDTIIEKENIKKLFNIAYQELNESDESKEFLNCLTSFILLNRVAKKFKNPIAEKNFLMKLFKGKMDEFAILKILGKSLSEAKVTPELSKSKEQLLKIIDNYHLKLVQDKLFNWLNEADKSNLKKWIETELDDLDCFVILSNIPNVLKLLTDEITVLGILNKNEFKMPY